MISVCRREIYSPNTRKTSTHNITTIPTRHFQWVEAVTTNPLAPPNLENINHYLLQMGRGGYN